MTDTTVTMQLGVGQVAWRMPSLVHRLQALSLQQEKGYAHGKSYALLAGLPAKALRAVGLSGVPSYDLDQLERLLERQGCTVQQVSNAGDQAFTAIFTWWQASKPEASAGDEGKEQTKAADGTD